MTAETEVGAVLAGLPGLTAGEPSAQAWGELMSAVGVGLAVKDAASGRYVQANGVLLGWMEREAHEVVGHTDAEIFDAPSHAALRAADQAALVQGSAMSAEHRVGMGARVRDLAVVRTACPVAAGPPRWLISCWTDLAAQRQHQAQLAAALAQIEQLQTAHEALRRELADHALRDRASGLYSKAHFDDQLRREVDLSSREHREFAIVLVQLDALPLASPDVATPAPRALQAVQSALGRLLRSGTRAMDAACRLDDQLFAVLLSGVGLATAHSRMEGLRRQCATEIVVHEGREARFTVSMGVASFPHTALSQAELLQACSAALHEALRRGGNHVALAAIRLGA